MARKRLTERFPFLLPLRRWQRKRCFYLKMYFDGCRYAAVRTKTPLEYTLFRANVAMRNERSGFPMEYQQNKVHNLRLAAEAMNGVVLHPSETFSFWRLARRADRHTPYKDGLVLVNGSVRPAYGGGLCMLSDLLYWCFLHTPLTVTERHGHAVEQFPAAEAERFPRGADATVSEGWCDLRAQRYGRALSRRHRFFRHRPFCANRVRPSPGAGIPRVQRRGHVYKPRRQNLRALRGIPRGNRRHDQNNGAAAFVRERM